MVKNIHSIILVINVRINKIVGRIQLINIFT